MLLLLPFIKKYWLILIVVFCGLAFYQQHLHIHYLQYKLEEMTAENAALLQANTRFAAAVQTQNQAVDTLALQGKKLSEQANVALIKAKSQAAKYQVLAKTIQAQKTSGNACADMINLVNNTIK